MRQCTVKRVFVHCVCTVKRVADGTLCVRSSTSLIVNTTIPVAYSHFLWGRVGKLRLWLILPRPYSLGLRALVMNTTTIYKFRRLVQFRTILSNWLLLRTVLYKNAISASFLLRSWQFINLFIFNHAFQWAFKFLISIIFSRCVKHKYVSISFCRPFSKG